jgi:hypothetical protein
VLPGGEAPGFAELSQYRSVVPDVVLPVVRSWLSLHLSSDLFLDRLPFAPSSSSHCFLSMVCLSACLAAFLNDDAAELLSYENS